MFSDPSRWGRTWSVCDRVRLVSCVSFVLAGCASTAGSSRFEASRADYARAEPRPAPSVEGDVSRVASLDRAAFVRAVLASNPSIESARQGWRAALARVKQAGSFEDPMLELQVAPLSLAASKVPWGYEVMCRQQLPWFGKRSLDASIAAAEAEATKSDFEAMKRELAMTAVMLYEQYFVVQRSLDINAEHVKLMLAMRDAATAQLASGRGSSQDALLAEAELGQMERDAIMLASRRDVVVAQMNELLHRPPDADLPPPPAKLAAPDGRIGNETRLQAEATHGRAEIAALRQRAHAEEVRAQRAERDAYPDFSVSTSYNSMWDMPEHRWMVGLGLSLPIFSGKRAGMAEEARAMRAQYESDATRLSDSAKTQVFVSLKQLDESQQVLQVFTGRLLPVARDRIDAARADFITGHTPFMQVIEAEKSLRSVELEYERAQAAYASQRAELDRALGKVPGLGQEQSR